MGGFEEALGQGALWAFVVAFGSGVATSLTPCVYPMIPITVSIFGAREARSRGSAFLLALTYVMGIAAMYTALGVLAGLAGGVAPGAILSSPWFVFPLAAFFLALASSMFGLWEIRLPAWLQNRLATVGGAGFGGAFAMGLVGGIIIAPCTGPWLAGLLGYVATTRSVWLGGALLFTYALGIGVLFLLIATFAVSLPKSGAWMNTVKSALGIPLVAGALYFAQNVVLPLARYASGAWSFGALNGGLLLAGIGIGGVHLDYSGARPLVALRKTIGILLAAVGLFGLINFALAPDDELPWRKDAGAALTEAQQRGRPVLIDFWASWCVPCKQLEATVLADPPVRRELERFVLVKVDVGADTAETRALQQRYGKELPLLIMLDQRGQQRARATHTSSAELLRLLRAIR